ncbi:MAG: Uma2 family endonuclease [Pseudanabaenaceae cyanobacterium bins.68]|nr:Uma2 family endonuclease [Pseudanabaenaceae cyanobacterium bins.68]
MVAAKEYQLKFTPEEYFAWQEQQEVKYEYIDGEVYAMTGGTLNHSEIACNLISLLKTHLNGSACRVLNSDARVSIHRANQYVYPDISVTCDRRDQETTQFITYPCLIVEVLSPTTEAYDRGKKFKLYQRADSLVEYVLVNPEEIEIDLFRKNEGSRWEVLNYLAGDLVELESLNLTFAIEQIYQGIRF